MMNSKNSNLLGVQVKNYGECAWCHDEENKVILSIPWDVWSQWLYLSQLMGKKEWGAVFWVKEHAITSFKLPKQEVSSIACEFQEELGGDGMVHSHHTMGAFHSSQDDRHARNLYEYSIVVSSTGYEATKKVKLPCGAFGFLKVELRVTGCPQVDLSHITEKEPELITAASSGEEYQRQFGSMEPLPCDACGRYECVDYQCLDVADKDMPAAHRDEYIE